MSAFVYPNDYGWQPRDYQVPFWNAWIPEDGVSHSELMWHRRAGKDDVVLKGTCVKVHQRVGNYWHMLPLANQARKAIWDAVNPHTGRRRIDESFPLEFRESTRDNDMLIRFKNGSSWQVFGSDNYEAAIGSTPAGIVYSEWPLANPSARGYLRPILAENKGWDVCIGTPRGKNHAYRTFNAALKNPNAFAQKLTIHDTGILTPDQLREELLEYVSTYGEAYGISLYEQEYECSFDAAILGAIWGDEFKRIDQEGRITEVPHDPNWPVHVATDLGRRDDLSIWWYQVIGNEIRVLEHYAASGDDPGTFCTQLLGKETYINLVEGKLIITYGDEIPALAYRQAYTYGEVGLPHDGAAKTFAAQGKSVQEQLAAVFGWNKVHVTPSLSKQDQIQAGRQGLRRCVFDWKCETDNGIDALRSYHREWDDEKKKFKDTPEHDWSSHPSDAWMQLCVAYQQDRLPREAEPMRTEFDPSFSEMLKMVQGRKAGKYD